MSLPESSILHQEVFPATSQAPEVLVLWSARRRKTVTAALDAQGRIRLLVPAATTCQQVHQYMQRFVPRVLASAQRRRDRARKFSSDEYLQDRADCLISKFLPGLERPASIFWVGNQTKRWASATPEQGRIRVSRALQGAPEYVLDFVIYHELCHFVEVQHNKRFRDLESRYPRKVEAEAFLAGMVFEQARVGST